jgi:hypothetical protein
MDAQLFIYADSKQLRWLNCCLRSAQRYWHSNHPPMLLLSPEYRKLMPKVVSELGSYVVFREPLASRKHSQTYAFLTADSYVVSGKILFMEPDALFTCHCSCEDFVEEDKPKVIASKVKDIVYHSSPDIRNAISVCASIIDELFDSPMEDDYESCCPHMFMRSTIRDTREAIERHAHRPLFDVITNIHSHGLLPWNIIGTYSHLFQSNWYCWAHENGSPSLVRRFCGDIQDPTRGHDMEEVHRILCSAA